MATLENNPDTTPCPHCGNPVRVGMIRCRECRGLLAEAPSQEADEDEFVLAPQVQALVKRACVRCGMSLEPGVDDCPNCASALLDEMMKGPEQAAEPSSALPADTLQSNPNVEAGPLHARPARPAPEWTPLRE